MEKDKLPGIVTPSLQGLNSFARLIISGLRGRFDRAVETGDGAPPATKMNLFLTFFTLGLTAFGGPAAVAHIKESAVIRNKWVDESLFKDGIALCQSIPGATAMQMAAYVGLRAGGIIGALLSYTGFGLPSFILMLVLSVLYVNSHDMPQVASLFKGLQVIVVSLVAYATFSFSKTIVRDLKSFLIAVVSAFLFFLGISPFLIIIAIGFLGIIWIRDVAMSQSSARYMIKDRQILKENVLLVLMISAGFFILHLFDQKLFRLALLMSKIDLFAFGGGFASLPLMFHEIVNVHGWIDGKTIMDGVALGQITPGPIIITSTFVGYLMYGFPGAAIGTVAIFIPSFLILIFITPFFDRLKNSVFFLRAVKGILASFIGLLLFTAVNFAFEVPWDAARLILFALSFSALLSRVDVLYVVLMAALFSLWLF